MEEATGPFATKEHGDNSQGFDTQIRRDSSADKARWVAVKTGELLNESGRSFSDMHIQREICMITHLNTSLPAVTLR